MEDAPRAGRPKRAKRTHPPQAQLRGGGDPGTHAGGGGWSGGGGRALDGENAAVWCVPAVRVPLRVGSFSNKPALSKTTYAK